MIRSDTDVAFRSKFVMNSQTGTPPQSFRIPSPSALPTTPTQDDADHKGLTPAPSSGTPGTVQAFQTAIRNTPGMAGSINTPGMSVSPLMENTLSPSPAQLLMVHDAAQAFSPGTPLMDKTNSTEPPLERLKRKVQFPL